MKLGKSYTLGFRRKRENRTDYRARLKLLSSRKPRVVIRKMLDNYVVQVIDYTEKGDKVLVASHTRELIKYGWKAHRGNLSAAYLVGFLCGKKAKKKNVKSGIVDLGFHRIVKGSGIFAVIKGLKDAGLDVPVGESALPKQERLSGKHIEEYAKKLKNHDNYKKQFSKYIQAGLKPEEISKYFEEAKKKISEKW